MNTSRCRLHHLAAGLVCHLVTQQIGRLFVQIDAGHGLLSLRGLTHQRRLRLGGDISIARFDADCSSPIGCRRSDRMQCCRAAYSWSAIPPAASALRLSETPLVLLATVKTSPAARGAGIWTVQPLYVMLPPGVYATPTGLAVPTSGHVKRARAGKRNRHRLLQIGIRRWRRIDAARTDLSGTGVGEGGSGLSWAQQRQFLPYP